MAKITIFPAWRRESSARSLADQPAPKSCAPRVPAFAPDPEPVEEKPQKTLLEKAAEVVEEVVKPKARRGRKKKPAAE